MIFKIFQLKKEIKKALLLFWIFVERFQCTEGGKQEMMIIY